MLASVRVLNFSWLRTRPLRTLLTVAVIGAGVALPVAVYIAQSSVADALAHFDRERSGPAPLEVVGGSQPGGVDARVLPEVASVDGVEAAIPMVQAVAFAEDDSGDESLVVALGVDCSIEAIVGDIGCATPSGSADALAGTIDHPLISPSLQRLLGPDGVVRTDRGRLPTASSPTLDSLDDINNGRVAVFSLPVAQELFSRNEAFDTILVVPRAGVDIADVEERLDEALGEEHQVRSTAGSTDWLDPQVPLLFLVSLLALGTGVQLAHNAVALALEERRGDLAVTSALGASRRTLLTSTLFEVALLGVVGGLLGLVGAIAVARPLVDRLGESAAQLTGVGVTMAVPPTAVLSAVLIGTAVALAASIRPAWRATQPDVARDLQARGTTVGTPVLRPYRRALVYLGCALASAAVAWLGQRDGAIEPWQPLVAPLGFVGVTVFLIRAAYNTAAPLLQALAAVVSPLRRGLRGVATDNLVGSPRRTGTLAVAAALAISLGVVLGSITEVLPVGIAGELRSDAPRTVQVSSLPAFLNVGIASRPEPEVAQRIAETDGVADVTAEYIVTLQHRSVGSEPTAVIARAGPPTADFEVYRGDPADEVLDRGEVALGVALARELGVDVGDSIQVPARQEMVDLRVGAIWANGWLAGRNITVPYETFEDRWGQHAPFDFLVTPQPGVSATALASDLQDRLSPISPDIEVREVEQRATEIADEVEVQLRPFFALQRGLLIMAVVATLSTLLLAGVQRRREFGVLTATGLAPSGLGRMVLLEAGLIGLAGTILGTLMGAGSSIVLTFVLPVMVGYGSGWSIQIDLLAPLVYGALATVCVVAGAILPAWRAARLDPAAALRYE